MGPIILGLFVMLLLHRPVVDAGAGVRLHSRTAASVARFRLGLGERPAGLEDERREDCLALIVAEPVQFLAADKMEEFLEKAGAELVLSSRGRDLGPIRLQTYAKKALRTFMAP